MLDDVQCTGRENKLLACSSPPILRVSSNCDHSRDAGVRCEGIRKHQETTNNIIIRAAMTWLNFISICHVMLCRDMTICHDMRLISEIVIYPYMKKVINAHLLSMLVFGKFKSTCDL